MTNTGQVTIVVVSDIFWLHFKLLVRRFCQHITQILYKRKEIWSNEIPGKPHILSALENSMQNCVKISRMYLMFL